METVTFYPLKEIADEALKFAVIAARYSGNEQKEKWIFCRHKQRSTWEIPGGHREADEEILTTAKRELQEETGAEAFELKPVKVYGVTQNGETTYGLLCFARVKTLAPLSPEMEIGELQFVDSLPEELTYPHIQPQLHKAVQEWLNLQTSPNELWDVYDAARQKTGRLHRRGDPLPAGEYHLVVHAWLKNSRGEYLLTQRAPNKGFPNLWECTGGSALAGDTSLTAALREVKEETGLCLLPQNGRCVIRYRRSDSFVDVWLFLQEFRPEEVVFQPGETCGARAASKQQVLNLKKSGELVPFSYLEEFLNKADEL